MRKPSPAIHNGQDRDGGQIANNLVAPLLHSSCPGHRSKSTRGLLALLHLIGDCGQQTRSRTCPPQSSNTMDLRAMQIDCYEAA